MLEARDLLLVADRFFFRLEVLLLLLVLYNDRVLNLLYTLVFKDVKFEPRAYCPTLGKSGRSSFPFPHKPKGLFSVNEPGTKHKIHCLLKYKKRNNECRWYYAEFFRQNKSPLSIPITLSEKRVNLKHLQ